MKSNKCFNLINPLAWFVQNNNAQTTPSLRSSSGADLKVKPMLELLVVQLLKKGREAMRLSLILACYVPIKNDEEKKIKKFKRREERSTLWGENSNKRFNLINPIVTLLAYHIRMLLLTRVLQESRQSLAVARDGFKG